MRFDPSTGLRSVRVSQNTLGSKSVCCLSVDVFDESFVWCGKIYVNNDDGLAVKNCEKRILKTI